MAPTQTAAAPVRPAAPTDPADLLREIVLDVLCLEPADYDPQFSLAEMGCDSLDVLDIQYRLEVKLDAPTHAFREPPDFNPLTAPLSRLEQYFRSAGH